MQRLYHLIDNQMGCPLGFNQAVQSLRVTLLWTQQGQLCCVLCCVYKRRQGALFSTYQLTHLTDRKLLLVPPAPSHVHLQHGWQFNAAGTCEVIPQVKHVGSSGSRCVHA